MSTTDVPPFTPWRLRFVDGAMRGRTMALRQGANRIGAAGGCDILLSGAQVRPHHATLVAGEVALAIEAIGGAPLRLNDVDVAHSRRGLVAGDRLGLGGLEIELERVDGDHDGDGDFLREAPAGPPPASARASSAASTRPRVWPLFAAGFAVSVGLLWWTLGPAVARSSTDSDTAFERVQRLLIDYPEVRLMHAGGGLQLDGFVESPLRLRALERSVASVSSDLTLRVQVVETLVEQARRFVGDPTVAVHYGGQGRLVLSGATDSEEVQRKIARLGEDLHPAARVDDRVRYRPKPTEPRAEAKSLWMHWQDQLPARIVSITESADGLRHIQLGNGQRYYEGAQLKSGAQLQRIAIDEIVVAPEGAP